MAIAKWNARAANISGASWRFACLGTLELSHALPTRDYDLAGYARAASAACGSIRSITAITRCTTRSSIDILEDAAARRRPVLLPLRIIMNWGVPMLELPVIEALVTRHPRRLEYSLASTICGSCSWRPC